VHCVLLDEATARQDEIECMKFVSGVLYDEAFPEIPNNDTRRHHARSWCLALSLMRSPPDRIR
jgi:hypothetical protein